MITYIFYVLFSFQKDDITIRFMLSQSSGYIWFVKNFKNMNDFIGSVNFKCLFSIFNSPKKWKKKKATLLPWYLGSSLIISLFFWENWRYQKDISKLTDLLIFTEIFFVSVQISTSFWLDNFYLGPFSMSSYVIIKSIA